MTDENEIPLEMDDVIMGVSRTVKLLNYMLNERSQLYGTVIYLLQLLEQNRVVMPPVKAMQEYHKSFFVKFDFEGEDFVVSLEPKEGVEEEDGNQDS